MPVLMVTLVSKCSLLQRSCVHAKRYWPATRCACRYTLAPCGSPFPGKAPTADTLLMLSPMDQHQQLSRVCDLLVSICTINAKELHPPKLKQSKGSIIVSA